MAFSKEWWHTDENGHRIGFMEPVEFESILAGYYGDRKWVPAFAAQFNFSLPTVYRWNQGLTPIPKHIAYIVLMMAKLGGPAKLPEIDAPWLPEDPASPVDKDTKAA